MRIILIVLAATLLAALMPAVPSASAVCTRDLVCTPVLPCQPVTACLDKICGPLPTEHVGPYVGFTGTSCIGGTAYVCTKPQVRLPQPLLPGQVSCAQEKYVVIP
jgi:hypothetical protein